MTSTSNQIKIAWYGRHGGEEPPLHGDDGRGAGAIFFSGCNYACVFCQNWQISQQNQGQWYAVEAVADIMLALANDGAICLDLVSPTIWLPRVIMALRLAKEKGLNIPVVWNSNASESPAEIASLTGLVDVYLPDFKFGQDQLAWQYSRARGYVAKTETAIKAMIASVGIFDPADKTLRGVIVRHLQLPGHLANSYAVLRHLAAISPDITVSLMSQYQPLHRASQYPLINRRLTVTEKNRLYDYFLRLGLWRGWQQSQADGASLVPDFNQSQPFLS